MKPVTVLLTIVAVIGLYLLLHRKPKEIPPTPIEEIAIATPTPRAEIAKPVRAQAPVAVPTPIAMPRANEVIRPVQREAPRVVREVRKKDAAVLRYQLQNGLMVVHGDIVAGVPVETNVPESGMVELAPIDRWQGGVIPYHIQPGVEHPERVHQAAAFFEGTAVRLVPYNGEADALVFEPGDKNCLSYVGRIGGKQPVWISPGCGPEEIAHEIMHALGFVHEQNRSDRDESLIVNFDNIDEAYRSNFEKMPESFMKLNGLGRFDFQSIMIYPPWMFAKNGKSTMEPRDRDRLIDPSKRLSAGDIERINLAYGLAYGRANGRANGSSAPIGREP